MCGFFILMFSLKELDISKAHNLLILTKLFLFGLNVLILTSGMVLSIAGMICLVREIQYINFWDSTVSLGGFALGAGLIIFLTSSMGFYGIVEQNKCLLFFSIMILLTMLMQLAVGTAAVLAVKNTADVFTHINTHFQQIFNYHEFIPSSKKIFSNLEKQFKCCGVTNYTDYKTIKTKIPPSCCGSYATNRCKPYEQGCTQSFHTAFLFDIKIIAYTSLGFAVIEVIAAYLAVVLYRRIIDINSIKNSQSNPNIPENLRKRK